MPQDSILNRPKNHDQADTDTGQSLGSFLQRERLKKQFTLEEVAEKTCIHIATLKAIESNDRNKMPAEVFSRGFIKLYADFLNLDKQEILERYDRERGNIDDDKAHSDNILSTEKLAESSSFFSVGKFLFFCILLGLVGLGYYFYLSSQEPPLSPSFSLKTETEVPAEEHNEEMNFSEITTNPIPNEDEIDSMPVEAEEEEKIFYETNTPDGDAPDSLTIEENETIPSEETKPPIEQKSESILQDQAPDSDKKVATVSKLNNGIDDAVHNAEEKTPLALSIDEEQPPAQEEKINLRILFTERTWIQISVDNNPPKDFLFDPEEERSWQASETLKLFLGNSGGARLFVDEKEVKITGASGSPLRITIPDDLPKYGMKYEKGKEL